ncbi:response regulator [Methylobacterium organophilum]|uniref:response regulator n=1 Tax=Methylobacterium organophilum TaxID=410 RepID=UPI001F1433B1|nr:response regulator [Methylobacterium organophilum]UMY18036.1 response regulator [Methylobacterium organophilum]
MPSSLKIVIADADEEVRLAVSEAAVAAAPDAQVTEIADGRALETVLAGGGIDILFIDSILPRMDGLNLVTWSEAQGGNCLIVLVTDLLSPQWPFVAKRIGAYDVVLKPLRASHVGRVVEASRVLRRKLSLLVADPGRETRALIGRLLADSRFRFEICEVTGGREALRMIERTTIDLAFVETNLPDFPALEVACRLNDRHPEAKIILSGRTIDPGLTRQFSTFGISGFLQKPFGFAEIDKMLHEAFGLWRPYLINALHAEERRVLESGSANTAGLKRHPR